MRNEKVLCSTIFWIYTPTPPKKISHFDYIILLHNIFIFSIEGENCTILMLCFFSEFSLFMNFVPFVLSCFFERKNFFSISSIIIFFVETIKKNHLSRKFVLKAVSSTQVKQFPGVVNKSYNADNFHN